jgi:CHAD domain-containing protein
MTATSTKSKVAVGGAAAAAGAGATAAATKALLDRRRSRARTYRVRKGEDVADGVRRIATGRADSAIDHLRKDVEDEFATAVHEARKDLKKLRSVLRLVRDPLGDEVYRAENDRYREAAQLLSGARDAEVKLETLAALEERFDGRLPRPGLAPLLNGLEGEREALSNPASLSDGDDSSVADAANRIEQGRDAIADWDLDGEGFELIADGLRRSCGRGRNRFQDTKDDPSAENVHEWRKRVKDLWYHLRIVQDARPNKLKKMGDRAHDLSDLLGDHHDLAVLREDAEGRAGLLRRETIDSLDELIEQRQTELLDDALAVGEELYAEKPKKFAARIEGYWTEWR